MHTASFCPKHLKLAITCLLTFISINALLAQNISLVNAYAHNDYWHKRPLFDALDNGYTNIEADIYLRHGKLIVAHIFPVFRRKKDLELLYFKPLADCISGNNPEIACPAYPLMLMIDIKSGADKTYRNLERLLQKYRNILSSYENGVYVPRQITVVLTGHKPDALLKAENSRLAFIDQDLMKIRQDTLAKNIYQTASCRYSRLLSWAGNGAMPLSEKERLCRYVNMAHKTGKKVRLWASPDNKAVWQALLNCGVDLINTDKLADLRSFLLSDGTKNYAKID